jgi:hypothetical protein
LSRFDLFFVLTDEVNKVRIWLFRMNQHYIFLGCWLCNCTTSSGQPRGLVQVGGRDKHPGLQCWRDPLLHHVCTLLQAKGLSTLS